jgi:hypothetical protein
MRPDERQAPRTRPSAAMTSRVAGRSRGDPHAAGKRGEPGRFRRACPGDANRSPPATPFLSPPAAPFLLLPSCRSLAAARTILAPLTLRDRTVGASSPESGLVSLPRPTRALDRRRPRPGGPGGQRPGPPLPPHKPHCARRRQVNAIHDLAHAYYRLNGAATTTGPKISSGRLDLGLVT